MPISDKPRFVSFVLIYVVPEMAKLRDERETIFKAFVAGYISWQNS